MSGPPGAPQHPAPAHIPEPAPRGAPVAIPTRATPGQAGRAEGIVDRLHALHPKLIDLSLDRLVGLLARLGHPERSLPPVIHVAGTNGKGSTCAVLRAVAEAAGVRAHVYTSPHLVRFAERIRLAGVLVTDAALSAALEEVEAANAGAPITVFEITTAAALLLFSRVPAELLVLEVGLGGRLDATNVVPHPVACAVASVSMDHTEFLGERLADIAAEKAGICRRGVPLLTGTQPPEAMAAIAAVADAAGAPLLRRDRDWWLEPPAADGGADWRFRDGRGALDLPPPGLPGPHQRDNAALAVAALRAWNPPWLSESALRAGVAGATWPARMQRLRGRLAALLPPDWELWLDGGHNPGAGEALAAVLDGWAAPGDGRTGGGAAHLVVGMKRSKAVAEFLRPLLPRAASLWAVAEPGQHLAVPPAEIVAASDGAARVGPGVADALLALSRGGGDGVRRVLVCGSLYLAGEVLKLDGTLPD